MAIYLQQLQRCTSGLSLVKRAAHQLEAELGYLQRKNITSINEANHNSNAFIKILISCLNNLNKHTKTKYF